MGIVDRPETLPSYVELICPTRRAIDELAGSARGREITARVLEDLSFTDEQVAITYPNRPKSILIDRVEWARSYAKLGGALETPRRAPPFRLRV